MFSPHVNTVRTRTDMVSRGDTAWLYIYMFPYTLFAENLADTKTLKRQAEHTL